MNSSADQKVLVVRQQTAMLLALEFLMLSPRSHSIYSQAHLLMSITTGL